MRDVDNVHKPFCEIYISVSLRHIFKMNNNYMVSYCIGFVATNYCMSGRLLAADDVRENSLHD